MDAFAFADAFEDAFDTFHSQVQRDHIDFLHPTYLIQPLIGVDQAFLVVLVLDLRWLVVLGMKIVEIVLKRVLVNSAMNGINQVVRRLDNNLHRELLLLMNEYFLAYWNLTWVVVDCKGFEDGSMR